MNENEQATQTEETNYSYEIWLKSLTDELNRLFKSNGNHGAKLSTLTQVLGKKLGRKYRDQIPWLIRTLVLSGYLTSSPFDERSEEIEEIKITNNDGTNIPLLKQQLKHWEDASKKIGEQLILAHQKVAIAEKTAAETKAQTRVVEVQLKNGTKTVKTTPGIFHEKFEKMLKLARSRENIFIYGPSGSGKTFIAAQIAECLKLPFGFLSCTAGMSEGQITGRLLPTGKSGTFEYVSSEFVQCYENGGVFLFDEMDAADPNILLTVNAALSNGKLSLVNRPAKPYAIRHPDFICIGAANTVGTGGDRMYSGRNKLDLSTLERFGIGKVFVGYDSQLEAILCPDDELRNHLLRFRRGIDANRLERAMTTRFIEKAYRMFHNEDESCRFTLEDINEAFFQGWRPDEANKVKYYSK